MQGKELLWQMMWSEKFLDSVIEDAERLLELLGPCLRIWPSHAVVLCHNDRIIDLSPSAHVMFGPLTGQARDILQSHACNHTPLGAGYEMYVHRGPVPSYGSRSWLVDLLLRPLRALIHCHFRCYPETQQPGL